MSDVIGIPPFGSSLEPLYPFPSSRIKMASKTLSRNERYMLTRLAWILVSLMTCSLVQSVSIIVLIDVYKFSSSYRSLMIVMIVFCLIVFVIVMFILLSRGGAKYQSYYLSFISFVLYVHAILCLYASGATMYFMASFPQRAGDKIAIFRGMAILLLIISIIFIYITTQVPHLVSFLREFRRFARSEKVFLPKFIFTCTKRNNTSSDDADKRIVQRRISAVLEKQALITTAPVVAVVVHHDLDIEKGGRGDGRRDSAAASPPPPRPKSTTADSGKPPKKRRFFFGA